MQHKRIVSLLIACLLFGRLTHFQATQSNLLSKDKKVVLPTLALMFLNNKLSNLANTTESNDTTKDNLQLKHFPFSKRTCLDPGFASLHMIPNCAPTPTPGDKVRLTTGKVAQIKAFAPTEKVAYFSYTVALNERISIKNLFDEHLAGLQSKLARCERQLALGDVVLVKNDAKIVLLDGSEDDLKPLDTKEITLNPGSFQKANPIGKVVYLDGAWVGLMQENVSLSLPLKAKTNNKHRDEKVEDNPLDKQQLSTKRLSRQVRWLVPTSHIRCILDREKRYKVYTLYDKHGKLSETKKHSLSLRYPLAARSPMGSLIYQTISSKFMHRMVHFTESFTHKVLLQGHSTQVLGTEQELLLPAYADGFLPSPLQALASGKLSLYTLSNKPNKDKAWNKYTYTLQPTPENYTAKLSLWRPYDEDEPVKNFLLPKNSAHQPLFWCDKKTIPCCYGITLKQSSQPLVLSFAKERDRRIFYHALVWLTSPYVLAIEEINQQLTGHTRLLACADINTMTLQQLAHHMQTQWLLREGTLHQDLHFLDPHFIFEKHQQQFLSKYYDWSHKKRYKKVHISCYRTSHPDCIVRFGRYPQLDNQGKTANICPEVAKLIDSLEDEKDLSIGQLHTEGCQGLCTYVDYLSGKNNDYTSEKGKKRFNDAKDHMTTFYHGRQTPCPNQSKCPYHTLTTHQAQCHRLLYSHAPRRTRAPQNLSNNYSPFKSQEDPYKARASQYQPSLLKAQSWDSMNGYLQQFMHEQIANGYLWRWAGKEVKKIFLPPQQDNYKKRLGYKKDDPSMLNVSALDCLPKISTIKGLFFNSRHQAMGYPLTLAGLAALYAYTAWNELCSDFNKAFRGGDYHRWRWMDGLLHKDITKLSFLEDGEYPLYTGFKNIQLNKTRQHDQRWQDYTSSTPYPAIATTFHSTNGIKITIEPSMRKSKHIPCCDVSWISPYPEEFEVLFGRGIAGHIQNRAMDVDMWEVKVTGSNNQLQQVSVWHKNVLQDILNHPLSMTHQLFGKSQAFNFVPATYHHLIDKLLSGAWIDVHQKLGLQKDQSLLSISAAYGHTVVVKRLLAYDDIKVNLQENQGASPLFMAAANGHTDIVTLLFEHDNIGVNLQNDQGASPLFISAQNGHTDIVKLLLDHDDIDINLKADKGLSPLFISSQNGHTDTVKLLLRHPKINVNLQTNDGASPLFITAQEGQTDIVTLLLKHDDIDVNLQMNGGVSPLSIATKHNHTDVITLLLDHDDTDVNLQMDNGISSLLIATKNGQTDIVKLLLDHDDIDVNLEADKGLSPLFFAAQEGHTDIVKLLLRHPKIKVNLQRDDGASPLFFAAQEGHTDIVKLLLDHGDIDVNLQENQGESPLYIASQNGHTDIVKLLLDQDDIKVNLQMYDGVSALFMAAQNGYTDIVKLLLRHPKIKVNLQRDNGASPLLIAAQNGHTDIVKLLLAQPGIQVNLATKNSKLTPRDAVYLQMKNTQDPKVWDKYYILRQLLIEKGGKLLACANFSPQPPLRPSSQQGFKSDMQTDNYRFFMAAQEGQTDVVKFLLDHDDINVNLQDEDDASPLFISAQNGHTDIVKLLLRYPKIDVNLKTNDGVFALFMAAQNGHTDIVKLLLDHDDIKVNLQTNDGASSLFISAQKGYTGVVKLLLRHPKIKVNLQINDGASPLAISAQNGHMDIVKLLLAQPSIQVNLAMKNPKFTPRDAVYQKMKYTQDPKVWDKYYILRQLLIEKGGKLLYYANAYPQPPKRPSNQQGLNVDMQNFLLSLFPNFG